MEDLINKNYKSIQKRGLINSKTKHVDFFHKLAEEVKEVKQEIIVYNIDLEKLGFELSDVILTSLNWAKHYNINIEDLLKRKIVINEKR